MEPSQAKPIAVTIIVLHGGPILLLSEVPYWIRSRTVRQLSYYVALGYLLRLSQPKPKDN
jgi:hypothetical protein